MNQRLIFCILLFLSSCAIQVPPGGGEKDVSPPEVVSSNPQPFQTNFTGNAVEIEFNEYVQVKDPNTQLIISPLLKNQPVVKVRKKSVLISFEEDTLLPNTTYTINFGSSLVDVNEGNTKQDYQFVFSTGPVIDSLSIKGSVIGAKDLKPDEGYTVMLYHNSEDSLPYLSRPAYFSRTAKDGSFEIRNISPGRYKVIALKDSDGDYKYTQAAEDIGFVDSTVEAGFEKPVQFKVFRELPKKAIAKAASEYPGKARITFTRSVSDTLVNWLDTAGVDLYRTRWSKEKDTLDVYYKNRNADSLQLMLNDFPKDTILIRLLREESQGGRGIGNKITAVQTGELPFFKPFIFNSTKPIARIDTSKIMVLQDSIPIPYGLVITDSLSARFELRRDWKQSASGRIMLLPAAVTNIFGEWNDTLQFTFSTSRESQYGSMSVAIDSLRQGNYLLQLVGDNDQIYYEQSLSGSKQLSFNLLEPRVYRLKFVNDINTDGRWTTGSYLDHRQAEQVLYYPESITVRANWDVDVKWNLHNVGK